MASGSSSWSAACTRRDRVRGLRLHVDRRDDVARAGERLRDIQRDVHVRGRVGVARGGRHDADDLDLLAADVDRVADGELGGRGVRRVEHGDVLARVVGVERPAVAERDGRQRPDRRRGLVDAEHGERVDVERSAAEAADRRRRPGAAPGRVVPDSVDGVGSLRQLARERHVREAQGRRTRAATPSTPVTVADDVRVERRAHRLGDEPRLAERGRAVVGGLAAVLVELERAGRRPAPGSAIAPVTVRSVPTP